MRVLVVFPPVTVARDFIDYPYFADLGAVQLAAVLSESADVTLVDAFALPGATLRWRDDGRAHLGVAVDELLDVSPTDVELVVVATTPFHRPPTRDDVLAGVVAGLRERLPQAAFVLTDAYQSGQHYVECDGADVLASYPEIDAWVKYEAEVALPRIVAALARGERPHGVIVGERPEDLDALALPAWDRIDLAAHDRFRAAVVAKLGRGRWSFPIDGRTLPLVTSRGCPFSCTHCSSNPDRNAGAPKTQRRLSAARVQALVDHLVKHCGATRLAVLDEMLNVNTRHFETVLAAIESVDVAFDVPNGLRADYLERKHLARMLGRTTTVSVSGESGSQRVLDEVVGKQLGRAAIERVAEDAHRLGVPLMVHFMIGLPGERAEEVNETLAFAIGLWDRFAAQPAVQFATPLPGTALARGVKLPVVTDWGPRFQTEPSVLPGALSPAELRAFKRTFDDRLRASNGPRKLVMNVTYACNNHCTFCAVGNRTQVDGNPVRQRELLAKYRRSGVELVDFDGGEPTLDPELVGLVRYARAIGYRRVNVTTNGRLCAYPEFADKLVRSGVTSVLFSVHGADARTHAAQVGVAEAFEQTTLGIRNCVAQAPAEVELGMNVTLTKGNHRQLPDIAALAHALGLPWLNIQFLTPFGRATKMVAPDTGEAARITMAVIDEWRDRMKLQVINLPFCFLPGYDEFLVGDLGKRERDMVFVNNDSVNLAEYLAARRVRKPICGPCAHACFCGGFYELDDVPEPPWIVSADDLVRRIDP
jgi:MoaA/NifB/PqqE/SkfB family radical SAM enzyme